MRAENVGHFPCSSNHRTTPGRPQLRAWLPFYYSMSLFWCYQWKWIGWQLIYYNPLLCAGPRGVSAAHWFVPPVRSVWPTPTGLSPIKGCSASTWQRFNLQPGSSGVICLEETTWTNWHWCNIRVWLTPLRDDAVDLCRCWRVHHELKNSHSVSQKSLLKEQFISLYFEAHVASRKHTKTCTEDAWTESVLTFGSDVDISLILWNKTNNSCMKLHVDWGMKSKNERVKSIKHCQRCYWLQNETSALNCVCPALKAPSICTPLWAHLAELLWLMHMLS